MSLHIHAPKHTEASIRIFMCPVCKSDQRFLVTCYEWYSPTLDCLGCGDSWCEGERMERPFMRGWRKKKLTSLHKWIEENKPQDPVSQFIINSESRQ